MAEIRRPAKWGEVKLPYTISYSEAIASPRYDECWSVYGAGFGLQSFRSAKAAQDAADKRFGKAPDAVFTITVTGAHTSLQVQASTKKAPHALLEKAMAALQAERDDLDRCPVHRKGSTNDQQ